VDKGNIKVVKSKTIAWLLSMSYVPNTVNKDPG